MSKSVSSKTKGSLSLIKSSIKHREERKMQNVGETNGSIVRINSIDEVNLDQIMNVTNSEDLKQESLGTLLDALQYLEELIQGEHVFFMKGYGFEDENSYNLNILVHDQEDDEPSLDFNIRDYRLREITEEIWTPYPFEHYLSDEDRELFDAIMKAGVLPIEYDQTRSGSE